MSPNRISERLAAAIDTLDHVSAWLDDEPEVVADVASVARDLADLKLEIERETFRQRVPA
jgi:hypothetical protein